MGRKGREEVGRVRQEEREREGNEIYWEEIKNESPCNVLLEHPS